MKRYAGLLTIMAMGLGFAPSLAWAGFEWVPASASQQVQAPATLPSVPSAPMDQVYYEQPLQDMYQGQAMPAAAPEVVAQPLDIIPSQPEPIALPPEYQQPAAGYSPLPVVDVSTSMPIETTQPAVRTANLSGSKLFIDPYPLRNAKTSPQTNPEETYKAMAEAGDKLHPVHLGPQLNTGAKPNTVQAVPTAIRITSMAKREYGLPAGQSLTPMMGAEPPPLPGYALPAAVESASTYYDQAVGFGKDLPLALALSQIIPPQYSQSFAKDVNAGATVSWEGGKPWNIVLDEMLTPVGMRAVIQDKSVIIQSVNG